MVAPERLLGPAQVVARRVARGVVGDGRGEDDVELGSLGATADLLAPVGVDLAGEIDGEGHGSGLLAVVGTGAAPTVGTAGRARCAGARSARPGHGSEIS